jgi:sporulation protein YlmC with PRC-barrel domain
VSKTTMTAAFAVMLAASMPLAYGQTTQPTPPANAASAAKHVIPNQIRMTQMNGATVYDAENANLGDIKDLVLEQDGRVAAVVLNVGATLGMGGKYVAVPMKDIKITKDNNDKPHFAIHMTKDQLKSAQAFDLNEPKSGTSTAPKPANPPADRAR